MILFYFPGPQISNFGTIFVIHQSLNTSNRMATAQGKQGIWFLFFPDREHFWDTENIFNCIYYCEKHVFLHIFSIFFNLASLGILSGFTWLLLILFLPVYFCPTFLGGLCLYLNHLIAWRSGISFWQFGTLPIGNFVKFGLKTPYDISRDPSWSIWTYVNFWRLQGHSSNLPKKDAFRKLIFFLHEGAMGLQSILGVVGGQILRLYGGTIFWGCDTLRGSGGALNAKCPFFHTFATA